MKKQLLIAAISVLCYTTNAQNVNIPDAAFKSYLVGNTSINTNGDTEIQVSEAEAFSGSIRIYDLGISDLTGIEAFTALIELHSAMNLLTSLDVSKNLALETLDCSWNQLTSLKLSPNTGLETLICQNNKLTSLDVSGNTGLSLLECSENQLASLDLGSNAVLFNLSCWDNKLTSLDLSSNIILKYLSCQQNQLTSLDVSANTALVVIGCGYNKLTSLDLSSNTDLIALYCRSNQLTNLNMANGNSHNIVDLEVYDNPDLTSIKVDDASVIANNPIWKNTDPGLVLVDDNTTASISDLGIEDIFNIYPNPVSSVLHIETPVNTVITITTPLGEEVLSALVNHRNHTIDVSSFVAGIYFLKTSKGDVIKFVKE